MGLTREEHLADLIRLYLHAADRDLSASAMAFARLDLMCGSPTNTISTGLRVLTHHGILPTALISALEVSAALLHDYKP